MEMSFSGLIRLKFFLDFGCQGNPAFSDDGNPGICRDAIQSKVAADPAGAARRARKWWAFDDGGGRKSKMRDEQQISNAPGLQIVLHKIKTRQLVVADGVHHRRIRAVRDAVADARFLAFELKPKATGWT